MRNLSLTVLLGAAVCGGSLAAKSYDPLKVADGKVVSSTFEVAGPGRKVPIRVYLPQSSAPAPVILFSHGLGGSRDNNPYLGNHWAKRGYAVVFVQHPGSDEGVWKDAPMARRMGEMKKAASVESFRNRSKDIPTVIDALERWNGEKGHALDHRLDLAHLGMSGHSFGALTTQAMAGEAKAGGRFSLREPRIDAAVMMSPSPPRAGSPALAFAPIDIPCLLMTGTKDDSPIGGTSPGDRLKVFPHLKKASAWQVVFDQGNHMIFSDRDPLGKTARNARYHRAILALTTAFWDAHLKGDAAAGKWLRDGSARSVLASEDLWQSNPAAGK
ncbi:alpha/beta hydrolase family protein [Luteolibacter marinus]|uniref:alpha/beta hydrolase family protein n=1 Tax=Luteolibacter marinus TaxID=2776705 RepID=UPI00186828DC|nr:CocE/NonD family hydrolase [Luteolibacter marinus]